MVQPVTIPLGGFDYAGNPLPPQTTFYAPGGPSGQGNAAWMSDYSEQPSQATQAAPQENNWLSDYTDQPPPKKEPPQVSEIGAASAALAHGITFGFAPAMLGAEKGAEAFLQGQDFGPAYEKGRQEAQDYQNAAFEQHPYIAYPADVAGAVPTLFAPVFGAGKAAMAAQETIPRIVQAAKGGALAGGLFGAGEATSAGQSPEDIAKNAAIGTGAGAVLGGTLGTATDALYGVGGKIASFMRGQNNPEAEASRVYGAAMGGDQAQIGNNLADQRMLNVAKQAGTPLTPVDLAGANAQRKLQAARNLSPDAQNIIQESFESRLPAQRSRMAQYIRSRFSAIPADVGQAEIDKMQTEANRPLYRAAYKAGEQGMWSPRLQELSSAGSAMASAAQKAIDNGAVRSVTEGFGAFNPSLSFDNGILRISRPGRAPSYPDMQFWDYTQRALRDAARAAFKAGHNDEGSALSELHKQLLAELDRLNPRFAQARGTAAAFFKASDAFEAGQKFLMDNSISNPMAARVIAKMKPGERDLFSRSFAESLANTLEKTRWPPATLKRIFVDPGPARQRIEMVLGKEGAADFEALVRVEGLINKTAAALGNSTTARQAGDMFTSMGEVEGLKEVADPRSLLLIAPLRAAAAKLGEKANDAVYGKLAEMFLNENPTIRGRAARIVANNPRLRTVMRYASDLTGREIINYMGVRGVAGSELTAAGKIMHPFSSEERSSENVANPYYGGGNQDHVSQP